MWYGEGEAEGGLRTMWSVRFERMEAVNEASVLVLSRLVVRLVVDSWRRWLWGKSVENAN